MDKKEIFDKVSSIVADHFDIDRAKITEDLNLKTDLDADSIDFVEFVLEVEDTFGAEIEDSEAEKLSTIGEVVDYIAAHQQDKNKQNHRDRDEALLCRRSFFQWKLHERKFFSLKN